MTTLTSVVFSTCLCLHTIHVKNLSQRCRTILYNQHSNQHQSPPNTHTYRIEDSWRQARASIKPVWVWEPFKGHFALDLQSSILLTVAPWWPSGWPWGRRQRGRKVNRGERGENEWRGRSGLIDRERMIMMKICTLKWGRFRDCVEGRRKNTVLN